MKGNNAGKKPCVGNNNDILIFICPELNIFLGSDKIERAMGLCYRKIIQQNQNKSNQV